MVLARLFGATPAADAFFVAFKLPNFFRRLFAEGAFNAAFIPSFSSILTERGREEALRFAGEVMAVLLVVLVIAVGTVIAPATGALSALGATDTLNVSPVAMTIIGLVAAETTHGTRMAIRPFVTVGTAGVGNPVVSFVEDAVSAVLAVLAIIAPIIAVILIGVLAWLAWRLLKRIRRRRGGPEPPPSPA